MNVHLGSDATARVRIFEVILEKDEINVCEQPGDMRQLRAAPIHKFG